jgi:hypothetical protein
MVAMFCGRKSRAVSLPRRTGWVRSAKNASSGALSAVHLVRPRTPGFDTSAASAAVLHLVAIDRIFAHGVGTAPDNCAPRRL